MTDEQIRLYSIARCVVDPDVRIRTIAEPAHGGILYTIETLGDPRRWFAVHSSIIDAVKSDGVLAAEIRRVVEGAPPNRT